MDTSLEERLSGLGYDTQNATGISAPKATKLIGRVLGKGKDFSGQPDAVVFDGYARAVVSMGAEEYVLEGDYLTVTNGQAGEILISGLDERITIPCGNGDCMYLPALCKGSFFWNDRLELDVVRVGQGSRSENTIARIGIRFQKETTLYCVPSE